MKSEKLSCYGPKTLILTNFKILYIRLLLHGLILGGFKQNWWPECSAPLYLSIEFMDSKMQWRVRAHFLVWVLPRFEVQCSESCLWFNMLGPVVRERRRLQWMVKDKYIKGDLGRRSRRGMKLSGLRSSCHRLRPFHRTPYIISTWQAYLILGLELYRG